ncbi:hypothetical protein [Streptomyces sp. GMY02]|uniref:hypothetical protein n=1 Tax=Streptomyces sp. GMY02 TaxID=1333528 RepID=UPI0020B766F7|nr:hypothetical protein [Streptomyces sp. GMY02]
MVLMGMAVTAVSGCVSVEPRPASVSVPWPGASSGAPGAGGAQPQIVQAPAREALEAIVPDRSPEPAPLSSPEPRPPTADPAAEPPADAAPEQAPRADRPRGGPAPVRPPRERPREQPERKRSPAPPGAPAPALADVCALGEAYGRWPADSPQARICARTYRN